MGNEHRLLNSKNFKPYIASRLDHWSRLAIDGWYFRGFSDYYHRRLIEIYRHLVFPGQRVLEFGCGCGDLLAALQPAIGVGIDFSHAMLVQARHNYPNLHFVQADAHQLTLMGSFDIIILSDLVNDLWDVQFVIEQLLPLTNPNTRLIINTYSHLWELPLAIAGKLKFARPVLNQNWLTVYDLQGMLEMSSFEIIRHWEEELWPIRTPGFDSLCNRFLVRFWPFSQAALVNFILARPVYNNNEWETLPAVSIIIPVRNESGNIPQLFERIPQIGNKTELIFIEGHSTDNSYETLQVYKERYLRQYPERICHVLRQSGIGKGDAVREGLSHASGDILMILDADLTVPPEDLPRFYKALISGKGEFVNGVRLVYPMDTSAMHYLNFLGNKFFSLAFSWILGRPIKDTLCGTKAFWRRDYLRIAANRKYFGDFDPFGDFDLIFGATRLGLKIIDLPIRYTERTYGATNIHRWRHGWLLLRMLAFAMMRIKFV